MVKSIKSKSLVKSKKSKSMLPATSHANDFWTDEAVCDALLKGLREGRDLKTACEAVGIAKPDYDRALKEGYRCLLKPPHLRTQDEAARAEFYMRAKEAVSDFERSCVDVILKACRMGDAKAAMWLLERRLPEVYGKRELPPLVASEEKQPAAIKVEIVDASSDAERLKRLEAEVDAETDGTPKTIDAEGNVN